MGKCAGEDVAKDFHVPMWVSGEAAAGRNLVLIDDAEATEAHVRGVVIAGEAEGVFAFEPAMIGKAALCGFTDGVCVRLHHENRIGFLWGIA